MRLPDPAQRRLRFATLLPAELARGHATGGWFGRLHAAFEASFERFRDAYVSLLRWNLEHRARVFAAFGLMVASGLVLLPFAGRDFFPVVDTGQFRLHVRAPAGTRVEETERYFSEVEAAIREIIPADEVELILRMCTCIRS